MTKICTLGTCVTDDVFNYTLPGRYQVSRFGGSKPTSLISDSINLPDGILESLQTPAFNKKKITINFKNNIVQQVLDLHPDFLIVDFTEEVLSDTILIEFKGKTIRLQDNWINQQGNWFDQIKDKIIGENGLFPNTEIKRTQGLQTPFSELEYAFKHFVAQLIKSDTNPDGLEEQQIIVIESYFVDQFIDNDCKLAALPAWWKVNETNNFLEKIYRLFYDLVPKCHKIKLPALTLANINHIWALHPLHYTMETYEYMAQAIDIITGYHTYRSTPEKLYLEQSLSNKFKFQYLNEDRASISASKEKIVSLEEELNSLKNDVKIIAEKNDQLTTTLLAVSQTLEAANEEIRSLDNEKKNLVNKTQEDANTIDELQSQITAMENSRSWRITKPLRAIKRFFRKNKK